MKKIVTSTTTEPFAEEYISTLLKNFKIIEKLTSIAIQLCCTVISSFYNHVVKQMLIIANFFKKPQLLRYIFRQTRLKRQQKDPF